VAAAVSHRATTQQWAKAKAGRIGQVEVSAILWLHNCLNHSAPPVVTANALHNGVKMEIDMCTNTEDEMLRRYSKETHVWYVRDMPKDWESKRQSEKNYHVTRRQNTFKSVHDKTGAKIFTESATGMEHVYPHEQQDWVPEMFEEARRRNTRESAKAGRRTQ